MHRVHGNKHGWIAYRHRGNTSDSRFDVPVPRHVRIIHHDLTPTAQGTAPVRFTLHKTIDNSTIQILGARPLRQLQPGISDRLIDPVDVESIAHDGMTDTVSAASASPVAQKNDLSLGQFDA